MEKPNAMFGRLIQKKIKGRGVFSKNEKPASDVAGTLANEKGEEVDPQPMDYSDHSNTIGTKNSNSNNSIAPYISKSGPLRQNVPVGPEYCHPIFVGTPSERSSSAPVSPVSGYDSPTPLLEQARLPVNAIGQRQPPPVTIYRSNRSRAMRWKAPVAYRRGFSPHPSEMSLSAPSSPGNGSNCYEQVSMDGFENTEDDDTDYDRPYRRPWASNFDEVFHRHRRLRLSHHTRGHSYHHHGHNGHHAQQQQSCHSHCRHLGETQDLLVLLRKLGLESLHQRFLLHGFSQIDQLGGLSRQRLIEMGVGSAEIQASLLTAAQLLTNSRIETPVCSLTAAEDSPAAWNMSNFGYDSKGLYASGDIIFPHANDYWLPQGAAESFGHETDSKLSQSVGGTKCDASQHEAQFGVRKHFPNIPRNEPLSSQHSKCLGTKSSSEFKVPFPPRMFEMAGSNMSSLQKETIPEDYPLGRPKTPVGILRKTSERNHSNGEANRNVVPDPTRKRTGSTPKSVKIDESSLQCQSALVHADSLEALVIKRLRIEWIDLKLAPYTNSAGESGIPIRLVERYAEEMDKSFTSIALILESLRERALKVAGLPFKPNYEDIRTQRYLNCIGIKTDNLRDFLTTIGLPMYADRLAATLGSADFALPASLTAVTDAQMVYGLNIPLAHVKRIRTEAALIPKGFLTSNTSTMPRGSGLTKQMIFKRQQHHHHHEKPSTQRQNVPKSETLTSNAEILDRV